MDHGKKLFPSVFCYVNSKNIASGTKRGDQVISAIKSPGTAPGAYPAASYDLH